MKAIRYSRRVSCPLDVRRALSPVSFCCIKHVYFIAVGQIKFVGTSFDGLKVEYAVGAEIGLGIEPKGHLGTTKIFRVIFGREDLRCIDWI